MTAVPLRALTDVQVLLDRPKGAGAVVSAYIDTSEAGWQSTWAQRFKQEAAQVHARLADDPQAQLRFARDVAAIRRTLDTPAARRARGMAVFSSADREFLQVFALGVPVSDRLVLDEEPYLVPLLEALHRQHRYLVVLTDSHRGRLFAAASGHAQLLGDLDEPVPRRQHSAGETWGKQQATIARHREDHILHYRKDLIRLIEQTWTDAAFEGLILLGDRETVAAVRGELPRLLASQVIHEGPCAWGGKQPGIDVKVRRAVDGVQHTHDRRLGEEVERRLRESYCVAAGPQEAIDALRNGQVIYPGYLVLEPDQGLSATRCPTCGAVFADMRLACPFCRTACDKVNLWQEILLFAARHHVPAHFITGSAELHRHGGVAAMLAREGPWEPVAAGVRVEQHRPPAPGAER